MRGIPDLEDEAPIYGSGADLAHGGLHERGGMAAGRFLGAAVAAAWLCSA